MIKKLKLDLEHCYGIKKLKQDLDFDPKRVIAIYAPNGSMKSSFAQAFLDLSKGNYPRDRYFPTRTSKTIVTDQNGNNLTDKMIMAVKPYDKEFVHNEQTSILLVNDKKRKEYEELQKKVIRAKEDFLKELAELSGSKKNLEKEISLAFTKSDNQFFEALIRAENEVHNQEDTPFSDILYDKVFDDRILKFLETPDVQNAIKEYIERYNELLASSVYFKKGVFNYYNAEEIAKALKKHGFFKANHFVTLSSKESKKITSEKELESIIEEDKQRILKDKEYLDKFNKLHKLINNNQDLRDCGEYISNTEKLLPHLDNIGKLKEDVFKSYFKTTIDSFNRLLQEKREVQRSSAEIQKVAREEQTLWEVAINTFNDRFHVPFTLEATNKVQVYLGQEKLLALDFIFKDGDDSAHVKREDLLEGLSTGEQKAFYILNIIFEVERRKKEKQETVFVIDDLADSFDYKNKYAIIEYLQEISDTPFFYQIILTHNFDFFRTIQSRYVEYSQCYMAYKFDDKICLNQASGIKNPFINDWKIHFADDTKKRIASIPFMRNLIEYTKGKGDPDYEKLTSLLHWRKDTLNITDGDLSQIYFHLFGDNKEPKDKTKKVYEIIDEEMKKCLTAAEGVNFENKIVLSIAIRLKTEKFMIEKIKDPKKTTIFSSNQTRKLTEIYTKKFKTEAKNIEVINKVNLMTPENIHLNSFMYEPILDMSDEHLKKLCTEVCDLT